MSVEIQPGDIRAASESMLTVATGREAELAQGYRRLEDFAALSVVWFWEMDSNLKYSYLSDRFTEVTGIPRSLVLGMSVDEFALSDDDTCGWREYRELLHERQPFRDLAFPRLHPDGRDIVVVINGEPVFDRSGTFVGYRGTGRESRGDNASSDRSRDSQALYQLAGRVPNVGFWEWDEVLDSCVFCSKELAKIHGTTVSEFLRRTTSRAAGLNWIHAEDRARYQEATRAFRLEREGFEIRYRVVRPDGTVADVLEAAAPIVDECGVLTRSFGFIRDVSEDKQVEERLRQARDELEQRVLERTAELQRANDELLESQSRLHELGASAREVFCVISRDWRQIIYVSEAYEEIWGRSCQSLLDDPTSWFTAIHADDKAMLMAEIDSKINGSDSTPGFSDCRIVGPTGEVRWMFARIYPIRDKTHKIVRYAGVAEDITERKAAKEALFQAQKMEAVGQLTGGVAHDFNNLLAVILGNSGLLRGRVSDDDEMLVQDIIAAGNRGAELTQQLLAFSRLQPLHPVLTDIVKLVVDMGELLRRTLGSTITVEVTSSRDGIQALVDPGLLENAVLNLALNARDAMPNGGSLGIRISHDLGNRNLSIVVRDDGVGMDEATLSRALEPFFTTKVVGEGTGLGLPMVYGFAKQSNGDLIVHSCEGEGTTAIVSLPCEQGPEGSHVIGS